jgi:hypothetical protein
VGTSVCVEGTKGLVAAGFDRRVSGEARTWFMHLPNAVLAFEPGDDEYLVHSRPPNDEVPPKDEWDAIRPGLAPTGRIPLAEVEFDDAARLIKVDTTGFERFVAA